MAAPARPEPRPVILMRPGAANDRLAGRLAARGVASWLWPAFAIGLPEDEQTVARRLADLGDVDMVILASPAAVAAAAHWVRRWPGHIRLATVGEGTARVIRAAWGEDVDVLFPPGDAEKSGSEALFALMRERGLPSRVLICRGQTGREWLADTLTGLGVDVERLCAYVRVPLELDAGQAGRLAQALAGPPPVVYITSTDAVGALMHAVRRVEGAAAWLRRGWAVTIHPRCAARLRDEGFEHVEITGADDEKAAACIAAHLAAYTS
ncbi:MAG: uroporphyrinogen-III synthase [Duodenibacillus sp.]|nr:uroporphyrinogen-III synthase [Duodenibacillus sp.]